METDNVESNGLIQAMDTVVSGSSGEPKKDKKVYEPSVPSGDFIFMKIQRNEELLKDLFERFIQEDGFVCGGFARFSLSERKDPVTCGDIDIYCKGQEEFDRILLRMKKAGYYEQRTSEAANTMRFSFGGELPLQLIKPLNEGNVMLTSDKAENILSNFDFTIARAAITFESLKDLKGIADKDFPADESKKILRIKNIHCPIAQVYRVAKYIEKGYWCKIVSVIQIFDDWSNRPTEYVRKIRDVIMKEEPTREEIMQLESLLHID